MREDDFLLLFGEAEVAFGVSCGASRVPSEMEFGTVFIVPVIQKIIVEKGGFGHGSRVNLEVEFLCNFKTSFTSVNRVVINRIITVLAEFFDPLVFG